MKTLLIILQNAYGVEPGYIPDYSRDSFRNSHTGRRLKEALPENIKVIIRNSSPLVGDIADSWFPYDTAYITKEIDKINPDVILACGVNAKKAIKEIGPDKPVVIMPHPAYRALSKETTGSIKEKIIALVA